MISLYLGLRQFVFVFGGITTSHSHDTYLLKKEAFDYYLPEELIAQSPVEPRDSSRLLVLRREENETEFLRFRDIADLLEPGDCLILNDSKVIPARIYGIKSETGARVEFLLLSETRKNVWEALAKPAKRAKLGSRFVFGDGLLEAVVEGCGDEGRLTLKFAEVPDFFSRLDVVGKVPLPPYIKKELRDDERYQTVYSRAPGSAAAPTAGLHFTDELIKKIKDKGVEIGCVTLHVGLGTFRPVKADDISEHKMHSERYLIPEETAELVARTKRAGKKVVAVGTTSCRTLESAATDDGKILSAEGSTDIFIRPGYKFKVVDALITNFHLPESTLIMLVSAFAGYERTMNAYKQAVDLKYRFFSFGDAMFII